MAYKPQTLLREVDGDTTYKMVVIEYDDSGSYRVIEHRHYGWSDPFWRDASELSDVEEVGILSDDKYNRVCKASRESAWQEAQ